MKTGDLTKRYKGEIAENYEKKRKKSFVWEKEQLIVEYFLRKIIEVQPNPTILDIPVGTGRFLPVYNNLPVGEVIGIDISEDMISLAKKKLSKTPNSKIEFRRGNVMDVSTYEFNPSVIVCTRLFWWLHEKEVQKVLNNFLQCGAKHIILSAQVFESPFICVLPRIFQEFSLNFSKKIYKFFKHGRFFNCLTAHDSKFLNNKIKETGFRIKDKKLVNKEKFLISYYIYWLT
ncbi:MAG: class I SAM-dependent methyltransferase [Elusimicrobiota bacterium]